MKQLLMTMVFVLTSIMGFSQNYTFLGEIHFDKRTGNSYLKREEKNETPYDEFIKKYKITGSIVGYPKVIPIVELRPKEEYYVDPAERHLEILIRVPKSIIDSRLSMAEIILTIRYKNNDVVVGKVRDAVELKTRVSQYGMISSDVFKLEKSIKISIPAEVGVSTMIGYLNSKLYDVSPDDDLSNTVRHLRGLKQTVASPTTKNYYKVINYIEPYISPGSFLSQEAWELHDSLLDMAKNGRSNNFNTLDSNISVQYENGKKVYGDYCRFYLDMMTYHRAALKSVHKSLPIWLDLGVNLNVDPTLSLGEFYFGCFFGDKQEYYSSNYRLPNLDIIAQDSIDLVNHYHKFPKLSNPRFSVSGGIYSTATSTYESTSPYTHRYFPIDSPFVSGGNIRVLKDSGLKTTTQTVTSPSIFMKVKHNYFANSNVRLSLAVWGEFQWQFRSLQTNRTKLGETDTLIPFTSFDVRVIDTLSSSEKIARDIPTYYLGLGIPVYYSNRLFDLSIEPFFGLTNLAPINNDDFANSSLAIKPYYAVRLSLVDNFIGLGLGCDYRNVIGFDSQSYLALTVFKRLQISNFRKKLNRD